MSADLGNPPERWPGQRPWAAVVAANSVVMLPLGLFCAVDGWPGVLLGVALLWGLGALAVAASPVYCRAVTTGGAAVALSQLLPVLQFAAGLYAMQFARQLGFPMLLGRWTPIEALVVTVIAGGLLLLPAMAIGAAVGLVQYLTRERDAEEE